MKNKKLMGCLIVVGVIAALIVGFFILMIIIVGLGSGSTDSSDRSSTASPSQSVSEDAVQEPAQGDVSGGSQAAASPEDVFNMDYIDLWENYSTADNGKWVGIVGTVSSITDEFITITEGLSGLTGSIAITPADLDVMGDYKVADTLYVVARVKGKIVGILYLEDAVVASATEEHLALVEEYWEIKRHEQMAELKALADSAIQITAVQIAQEYSDNEVRADENYKGKQLLVTGTVESIGKNEFTDGIYINLSDGNKYSFTHPRFSFSDSSQTSIIAQLDVGDTVSILCIGDGTLVGSPSFRQSYIVEMP